MKDKENDKLPPPKSPKTALITGSYGALGEAFATIHAQAGGDLILVGRSSEKLNAQSLALRNNFHIKVFTIVADLSLSSSAKTIYDACHAAGVTVDYLINCAGFGGQGDFVSRPMELDLSMIAVNIEALTSLCKLFLGDFVKRGSGRVLNVSSTAALMPGPLEAVYFATKAFVTSLSQSLWRELRGTGVTVTVLMPGAMKTPFITRGGLEKTKLFAVKTPPAPVAKKGYRAMLKGKREVVAGLLLWQRPLIALLPLLPKSLVLDIIYYLQRVDK